MERVAVLEGFKKASRSRNWVGRTIIFALSAALIAGISYRFFFPGYLNPFAIYHLDHFTYQGMGSRGYGLLVYFQKYPRPVAHVLMDLCGRLGPHGVLVPVFLAAVLNAGLLATYVERQLHRSIPLPAFALFAGLAFTNPEFYVHVKADPFSIFALCFLLIGFHLWQSYIETHSVGSLVGMAVSITLLCLTKESYFLALALFLLIQCFVVRSRIVATVGMLVYSAANMAYALHRDASTWTILQSHGSRNDTYASNFSLSSLIAATTALGEGVLFPAIVVGLVAILVGAWFRAKSTFWLAISAIAIGTVSWIPNASLPNHLEVQYSCLAILFILAPFLLVSLLIPAGRFWKAGVVTGCLLIYGMSVYNYQSATDGSTVNNAGWVRAQERSGISVLDGLYRMKAIAKPHESSLVSGIEIPYNPFRISSFVAGFFGPYRFWTVVVPDDVPESDSDTTRLIHSSSPARLQSYAHWFKFSSRDRLDKVIDNPAASAIAPELNSKDLERTIQAAAAIPSPEQIVFYASPNPVKLDREGLARTTIYWKCSATQTEVHVGSPGGQLFNAGGPSGEASTGPWITPDMSFYLQDASSGDRNSSANTLARFQIHVSR